MTSVRDEIYKEDPFEDKTKIATAVVTGEHPFNVPAFHRLFRGYEDIEYYPQHIDQYVADFGDVRNEYDVIVFYNFNLETPGNETAWWKGGTKEALEKIGSQEQGIVILHHAMAAFPQWEFWSNLMGNAQEDRQWNVDEFFGCDRNVDQWLSFGETLHIEIIDPSHPIVSGLDAWDLIGETWNGLGGFPGSDCHVLLTIDHPKMEMKAMAWTYQFKKARVFCFQPGHNNDSWSNENFQIVLGRGIRWAAKRL